VFGKLTVQKELGKHAGRRQYLCVCICGKPKKVSESSLISGHTTSCGCARKTHGIWYDTNRIEAGLVCVKDVIIKIAGTTDGTEQKV